MAVKIHDCRIFHGVGTNEIIREYTEKRSTWKRLFEELNLEMNQVVTPELVEPHLHTQFSQNDVIKFTA